MSFVGSGTPYRRDEPRTRVPVVLPLVEVTVDDDGNLAVTLDHEPYSADGDLTRTDLRRVVQGIATDLDSAVRIEVHEADHTTFTDIITPPAQASRPEPPPVARKAIASAFGISGGGFDAGEQVDVCVIVAKQVADDDGSAQLRLPPALLADHPQVVLVGRNSGVVALSDGAA